jgi:two-component system sensor histidine kinase KdpD
MGPEAIFRTKPVRFAASLAAVLLATVVLSRLGDRVNLITVALVLLLIVLAAATFFGRNPALLASFAAMLVFNYFFLPPVGTWHIAEPQNLIAWAAFTIAALLAGELSAYAGRRSREAERLYEALQATFDASTQAEALRQSDKLKSALLDAVTHDLRTPLTSIKAAVTTLLDSEGGHRTIELNSEGRTEFLSIIDEETDRLNGFIEGMVQLAKIEAGSATASESLSNVEEIITIALERAEPLLVNYQLTVNLQKELPLIRADARAMAEVVYNLVENAVKYSTPKTEIAITAACPGSSVIITVTDEGKGIPTEMRERVLEKFVRLDGEGTQGLGLGLSKLFRNVLYRNSLEMS